MKIISWNTFGIRTALPNLQKMLESCTPDIVCLQETKIRVRYANFTLKAIDSIGMSQQTLHI